MLEQIRARLIVILDTLTPVSGTYLTLAENVPTNRQDYEQWVLWVRMPNESALPAPSQDKDARVSNWVIEITSPQISTGWPAQREVQQLQYAVALRRLLRNHKRLEDPTTRQALSAIQKVTLGTITTRAPRAYPDGTAQQYYSVTWALAIEYTETIPC